MNAAAIRTKRARKRASGKGTAPNSFCAQTQAPRQREEESICIDRSNYPNAPEIALKNFA
jgi:hypothetical protein